MLVLLKCQGRRRTWSEAEGGRGNTKSSRGRNKCREGGEDRDREREREREREIKRKGQERYRLPGR